MKTIRTEEDYKAALDRLAQIMSSPAGSPEREEVELLYDVVEHYEDRHHQIGPPTPIEAIRFRLDQMSSTDKSRE